jgi:hypothetical protein
LAAIANICTGFGRVRETAQLSGLLEQAADTMNARGLIVWLGNSSGADLRPVLAHGYSDSTLERIPSVARSADNAAAAAYRSGELQIVKLIKNGAVVDTTYHRAYHTEYGELEAVGLSSSSAPMPMIAEVLSETMNQHSMVLRDGSGFKITVRGAGFHSSSLVQLNGQPLETTFVSRTELRADVPERLPMSGSYTVTVFTPWPGGGTSNVKTLAVK